MSTALGLALSDLQEGVETRFDLVTVVDGVLGLLIEVDEWWIRLEQGVRLDQSKKKYFNQNSQWPANEMTTHVVHVDVSDRDCLLVDGQSID